MAFNSHPFNNQGTLSAVAGANPIHAGILDLPDHQPAAYQLSSTFQPDASTITLSHFNPTTAPMGATVANSNGWAAKEAWEKHQAVIKQLYLHDRRPLEEVMRLMRDQHGFRATLVLRAWLYISRVSLIFVRVKMYKTYIKKWGLDKKNKEPELRAIVRKYKQRQHQGKSSTFHVRGQHLDFAEVVRYWERKGLSIDDIIARQTASPTPEAVKVFTPVPSPILTPPELAIPERIFRCVRDYFKGSFESGTWVRTKPTSPCYSLKSKNHANFLWHNFFHNCDLALSLFERYLFHEAGQTLIFTTGNIKKILSAEGPDTLTELFSLIGYIRHDGKKDEIALSILRQFTAMGQVLLKSEHPLSRICEWAGSLYGSVFDDIVIRGMEIIINQLESSVGPLHMSTVCSRLHLICFVTNEAEARIQMLQKLHSECEKTLRPDDIRFWVIRSWIADEYTFGGCYDEARILIQKNLACLDPSLMSAGLYEFSWDLSVLADCQYYLGEVELGIAALHQAIDMNMSTQGPLDRQVTNWLLRLEDWYVEQELWDDAIQARERRLEIHESMIWLD